MIKETRVENGMVRGVASADPRVISYKGIPLLHAGRPSEMEGTSEGCRLAGSPGLRPVRADQHTVQAGNGS